MDNETSNTSHCPDFCKHLELFEEFLEGGYCLKFGINLYRSIFGKIHCCEMCTGSNYNKVIIDAGPDTIFANTLDYIFINYPTKVPSETCFYTSGEPCRWRKEDENHATNDSTCILFNQQLTTKNKCKACISHCRNNSFLESDVTNIPDLAERI